MMWLVLESVGSRWAPAVARASPQAVCKTARSEAGRLGRSLADRPGLRITGDSNELAAPGSPLRKRMAPALLRTTLSGIPSPVRSARKGVFRWIAAVIGEAKVKAP